MIFTYITCKDKKEARKIGLDLVKKRLAACCVMFGAESIYRWQGKIVKDREAVLIVKTLKNNFRKIEKEVKRQHSHKTPCVLEIPLKRGNLGYLNWLEKEVKD